MKWFVYPFLLVCVVIMPVLGLADEFKLRDGHEIEGCLLGTSGEDICLRTAGGVCTYRLQEFDQETIDTHFKEMQEALTRRVAVAKVARQKEAEERFLADVASRQGGPTVGAHRDLPTVLDRMGLWGTILRWMVVLGGVVVVTTSIALIMQAYQASIWWGLLVLLTNGIGGAVYTFKHWKDANGIFYFYLLGLLLVMGPIIYVKTLVLLALI